MNALKKWIFVALGFMASPGAMAAQKLDPALRATSQEKFENQADAIRERMKPGGDWQFVDSNQRSIIERRFVEISDLLEGVESVDTLLPAKKAKLLMAQEDINAILTRKEGRRIICEASPPVGSHRMQHTCQTFERRDRDYKETYKYRWDRITHRDDT